MKIIKLSKTGVTHFPIIKTLDINCIISKGRGYTQHRYTQTIKTPLKDDEEIVPKGTQFVQTACKVYNLSVSTINYYPEDALLVDNAKIEEGEVQCKNCLRALGLLEKLRTADDYLFALRCTISGEYKTPSKKLSPHLTEAKFFKKENNALSENSIQRYRTLSGALLNYGEYRKLSQEERKTCLITYIQDTKFEIVKVSLNIEK